MEHEPDVAAQIEESLGAAKARVQEIRKELAEARNLERRLAAALAAMQGRRGRRAGSEIAELSERVLRHEGPLPLKDLVVRVQDLRPETKYHSVSAVLLGSPMFAPVSRGVWGLVDSEDAPESAQGVA